MFQTKYFQPLLLLSFKSQVTLLKSSLFYAILPFDAFFPLEKVLAGGAESCKRVAETAWWDLADIEIKKENGKTAKLLMVTIAYCSNNDFL
jgi:hypothetical protein